MIEVEALYKSFDGVQVLKGVSFKVAQGEVTALIGRSGDGKSVLLKHLAGLLSPDRGRVLLDRQDIGSLRGRALQQMRARLGFLFQGGALFDSMTLFDNVAFPLRERSQKSEPEIRERVLYELNEVDLIGAEHKFPAQVSGGMQKRVALARALIQEPEIMLFDEPTTGLDPLTGQTILKLIDACHRRLKFTGIIVTHEIPRIFAIVNRVVLLHEGMIQFEGTPDAISSSRDPLVKDFLEGNR